MPNEQIIQNLTEKYEDVIYEIVQTVNHFVSVRTERIQ